MGIRSLPPSCCRSLMALGYPSELKDGCLPEEELKRLVLWLEDTKIRLLASGERAGLKDTSPQQKSEWMKSFGAYLKALGIHNTTQDVHPPGSGDSAFLAKWSASEDFRLSIIQKLVSFAIEDVYLDLKEGDQIDMSTAVTLDGSNDTEIVNSLSACVESVNAFMKKFNLPLLPEKPSELTLQMLASAIEAAESRIAPPECSETCRIEPNLKIPISFNLEVADPQLRNFCSVLRLVHTSEIRKLQQHINETLTALQEVTGNPKTDTYRQGRVGR